MLNRQAQRKKAVAFFEELPRFHETSGAPLNDAASRLVEGRLTEGNGSVSTLVARAKYLLGLPGDTRANDVPRVRIASGTWKYVLLAVDDSRGGKALLVRNQPDLAYHAEMADAARRELSALGGLKTLSVLGGGRIANPASGEIQVYGFSKTYGRCELCNKMAAELIRAAPEHRRRDVSWSNEGY